MRLILLFTVVPLAELALLIQLGRVFDVWTVLGLVVLTGILGAMLARLQGIRVWYAIRRDIADGILPADGIIDGLMVLLAGAMLLTPGVLTDAAGFALLVPPLRKALRETLKKRLHRKIRDGSIHVHSVRHDDMTW